MICQKNNLRRLNLLFQCLLLFECAPKKCFQQLNSDSKKFLIASKSKFSHFFDIVEIKQKFAWRNSHNFHSKKKLFNFNLIFITLAESFIIIISPTWQGFLLLRLSFLHLESLESPFKFNFSNWQHVIFFLLNFFSKLLSMHQSKETFFPFSPSH